MPNRINTLLLQEYKEQFKDASTLVSVGYEGLSSKDTAALRDKLAEANINMTVVKNRIANIALKELGCPEIMPICEKMTALATAEDPVMLARFMVDFRKGNEAFKIHGALVENTILDTNGVVSLSKSPNKQELQGMIVGQAMSPGSKIAGALMGPASTIAGQIKSMVEKMEESA